MLGLPSASARAPAAILLPSGPPLGVVAALPAEGRCLARRSLPPGGAVTLPGPLQLRLSGIGPRRARRTAEALTAAGARALVSWGVAGGIDPSLPAGTLLLPLYIQTSSARIGRVDERWQQRLADRLRGSLPISTAPLYHAEQTLARVDEKARLYRRTGCSAVDMESGAIGEVAARAGVPFVVIRAVADPASAAVPSTALQALDDTGRLQCSALLKSLLQHPQDMLGLWQLAGDFRTARTSLRTAAARAGARLLAPDAP